MKIRLIITVLIGGFLAVLTSCVDEDPVPEEKENPFELEVGWNGFIFDGETYSTPNAIIEYFGENLDSLTANYDISFTDGIYNPTYRTVTDYTIRVYFDANSPSLDELSTGIYYFENTPDREANIIGQAYIIINSIDKYNINEGTVEVSLKDGFFLIEYLLKTVKDHEITDIAGQYTGLLQLIDQTFKPGKK